MKSSLLFIECILSFLLVFSQNSVLVPDYGKPVTIAAEDSDHNTLQYLNTHKGNYISQYYPSGHFWTMKTHYTDTSVGINDTERDVNPSLSYTIPSSGYLYVSFQNEGSFFKNIMSNLEHHRGYGLRVMIYRNGNWITSFSELREIAVADNDNILIPVSKGDIVYYGTWYDYEAIPSGYQITFYPGKSVDAKTGD